MFDRDQFILVMWGEFRSSTENMSILLDHLDRTYAFQMGHGIVEETKAVGDCRTSVLGFVVAGHLSPTTC